MKAESLGSSKQTQHTLELVVGVAEVDGCWMQEDVDASELLKEIFLMSAKSPTMRRFDKIESHVSGSPKPV
jgi:hypothetical protein